MQVCYPSTPAQIFHLLRRQLKQPFRRPLIVFTPKSLLRHPACRSTLDDLAGGRFEEVIADPIEPGQIKSPLLCSGKIYYDLVEKRADLGRKDVALVRIEQIYPLHRERLAEVVASYGELEHVAWVQEEPRNNGAWSHLAPQLTRVLGRHPRYVGREESAAPAVGSHRLHKQQQEALLEEAFNLPEGK